jgi:hypothetical protein
MRSTDPAGETNGTDESLMAAVRDGDSEKLGILFDRHHGSLFDLRTPLNIGSMPPQPVVIKIEYEF